MSYAICPFCGVAFKETVPINHKCKNFLPGRPRCINNFTGNALNKFIRKREFAKKKDDKKWKLKRLVAAIDLNTENLCWVFGSDGASFVIDKIVDESLEISELHKKRLRYFYTIAKFLQDRYDYLYVGHYMPTEDVNERIGIEQFRIILNVKGQVSIIDERKTTITCSLCGHEHDKKEIGNKRVFTCWLCEKQLYRDENAARNILNKYHPGELPETKVRFIIEPFEENNITKAQISIIDAPLRRKPKYTKDYIIYPTEDTLRILKQKRAMREYFNSEEQQKIRQHNKEIYYKFEKEVMTKCSVCGETLYEKLYLYNTFTNDKLRSMKVMRKGLVKEERMKQTLPSCICMCKSCIKETFKKQKQQQKTVCT